MNAWMMWLTAAGVMVILEMFTGTFYLLMISLGLIAGGIAAWAGADHGLQFILAGALGIAATAALRRSRFGKNRRADARRDPSVNPDIGQSLRVDAWEEQGGAFYARASYRGASWDVELQHDGTATPGWFVIREVQGSRLIVSNRH
jgi:membrane protein implicated in regulation of membrane protease activity